MPELSTTTAPTGTAHVPTWKRSALRWMVSFVGFPLGGAAALIVTGPADSVGTAAAGGLIAGAVLGAVQSWAMGKARPSPTAWSVATAVGLMLGLALGASLVDFGTRLGDLVVQGIVCGAVVGLTQAVVLLPRIGARALAWPLALSGVWGAGWVVSTSIGVQVDEQFIVFGSSGALLATALTAVLPLTLTQNRTAKSHS